jgi:hypothetical protein
LKLSNTPNAQKNDYYSEKIAEFFANKDSIIEMAKIISYDKERLVARVYTISSQQYRDDVPVFFPSMYLNTGIISPPVIGSTSLLYWGPDRQPFLLPVQLTIPNVSITNGVTKLNASPGFYDEILGLKNIQGGEHLIRSMGGSYLFLKNIGEVELGTSRLHRLTLSEKDGAFDLVSQRIRAEVGNARFYFGPASMDSNVDTRTNFFLEFDENADETSQMPTIDDNTLLDSVLNNNMDSVSLVPTPKIFTQQMIHVLGEEGVAETDEVDGTELFSKSELNKAGAIRTETLSKGGRKVITTSLGDTQTDVIVSPSEVKIVQQRLVDGVANSTHIGINSIGQVVCSQNGVEYDIMPMLKWFYEQRTV